MSGFVWTLRYLVTLSMLSYLPGVHITPVSLVIAWYFIQFKRAVDGREERWSLGAEGADGTISQGIKCDSSYLPIFLTQHRPKGNTQVN